MTSRQDSTLAIIDLGTQSALYLFADHKSNVLRFGRQALRHVRLGEGLIQTGRIGQIPLKRAVQALKEFADLAAVDGATRLYAAGTRVFRWAANGLEAAQQISMQTGIPFIILNEDEEARYGFSGATLDRPLEGRRSCVIDIGGGSTELSLGDGCRLTHSTSLDIGAVGLTEKWAAQGRENLAVTLPWKGDQAWINRLAHAQTCIGVAGTATTLAALELGLSRYDANRVDGFQLTYESLTRFIASFSKLDADQRRTLLTLAPQRADILLAGAVILRRAMEAAGSEAITVSDRGLRHGLALAAFEKEWPQQEHII